MLTTPVSTRAQEPSLTEVLARAAQYVTDCREQLSGIVAEEAYEQRLRTPPTYTFRGWENREERRKLRSDFLLVRPEGQSHY